MKPKDAKEYVFNDLLGMQSYCKNHYEQYYSTSDFSCNITQLSKGELLTSSICAPIKNVHLEIFKSNQTLLYEEEANCNSVAFCWIGSQDKLSESKTIISGHRMQNRSIAGFNRLNKTGGNIWDVVGANTLLCCMSLKWDKMKSKINKMNAYNAYARLEECIGIDSQSEACLQLKRLFGQHFSKGLTCSDEFYDLAITTLEEPCVQSAKVTERSDQTDLVEDLVKLLHEDRQGLPPLTIGQIAECLNSEKQSLGEACQMSFNMGILDLIKSIRLEQVKKSYLNPHVPCGLKHFTKKQNAHYYGFNNWNSFRRIYFTTFQQSPEETIDKSSKISVFVSDLIRGK
ncbi:AraC family transcriptional regulator [Synechococcus sp. MIT S1220]|uniref:AraC family transcriptional regulator n=1 Tax=Synechococcus sp. MIT S1220 TaxID=3082549 RepID=UPI0039AEB543